MKIEISSTEKHPISAGVFRDEQNTDHLVIIFGIAKVRGDNMVYSTRVTDAFFDVLKKYGLTYLRNTELGAHQQAKRLAGAQGMNFDSIGMAYNIRLIMNAETYTALINELCKAIDTAPISEPPKPGEIKGDEPPTGAPK